MSEAHAEVGAAHDDHPHIDVVGIFWYLVALTIATSSTLILAKTGVWGSMTNIFFVFMISCFKASLVCGYFMHLRFEKEWKYVLCVAPLILAGVAVFSLFPDVAFQEYAQISWNQ